MADKKASEDVKVKSEFNFELEMQKKIKLSDGSEEFMYARGPKYAEDNWPIQCFVCRIGRILNEKKLENHVINEKHVTNLKTAEETPPSVLLPYEQIYSDRMDMKNPIKIYPGESITELTTDYADRLLPIKTFLWDNPPAEGYLEILQSDIIMDQNKKSPILGLCYGFKMAKEKKVSYYCVLCDAELTELDAYQHFKGKDHFNRYVEKHYPKTLERISKFKGITEDQKTAIIRHIYQKLETIKGHRPFYLVNGKAFAANKERFTERVHRIYHYNDDTLHYTDKELSDIHEKIKKRIIIVPANPEKLQKQPKKEEELTELPADVEEKVPEMKPETKRMKKRKRKGAQNNNAVQEKQTKGNEGRPKPKLDETPENWAKYRNLSERALQSLNQEYQRFYAVSERHPKYKVEWGYFYRNMCERLRRERINPNNYDMQPEWNEYWKNYLQQCYKIDGRNCKFELRKKLNLPFRARTPEPQNLNVFDGCLNAKNDTKSGPTQSGPVPLMSIGSIFSNNPGNMPTSRNAIFSGDNPGTGNNAPKPLIPNQIQPSANQAHQIQQQQQQQQQQNVQKPQVQNDDKDTQISVLSVLRLLTTLENELGSLGPTSIQLLGKAILYEKETKQSANELLHETEFFTLFATSLEKLRGLLTTGLIPDLKAQVAKTCTNHLEKIINLFEEYLKRNPEAAKKHIPSSVVLKAHQTPAVAPVVERAPEPLFNSSKANENLNRPAPGGMNNYNSDVQQTRGNIGGTGMSNRNYDNDNDRWRNDSRNESNFDSNNRWGNNRDDRNYDMNPARGGSGGGGGYDRPANKLNDVRGNYNNDNYQGGGAGLNRNTGSMGAASRNDLQRNQFSNNNNNRSQQNDGGNWKFESNPRSYNDNDNYGGNRNNYDNQNGRKDNFRSDNFRSDNFRSDNFRSDNSIQRNGGGGGGYNSGNSGNNYGGNASNRYNTSTPQSGKLPSLLGNNFNSQYGGNYGSNFSRR